MVDTGGALVVLLEAGSDVTVGLWCDVCLQPSVVEFSLVGLLPAGVSGLGTIRQCTSTRSACRATRPRRGSRT